MFFQLYLVKLWKEILFQILTQINEIIKREVNFSSLFLLFMDSPSKIIN